MDKNKIQKTYVRITILNFDELPIYRAEGEIRSGSISIDGTSSVRRTCSLSFSPNEHITVDYHFVLNKKFKIEIGTMDSQDEEISWFPQGIFVASTFSVNESTNEITVSISGKDKMCLLNGDISGSLYAPIVFDNIENVDGTRTKITLATIIKEALHMYAKEPYHNIVINDLDETVLQEEKYLGSDALYLRYNTKEERYDQLLPENQICFFEGKAKGIALKNVPEGEGYFLIDNNISPQSNTKKFSLDSDSEKKYQVRKISSQAGYTVTPFIYDKDLIAQIGDSLTSILDKIVQMLGNYEYFYNLDGQFIFQRKKTYTQVFWNSRKKDGTGETYVENNVFVKKYSLDYGTDKEMIISLQKSPIINEIRNDFSVWGQKKNLVNTDQINLLHYRYAVDKKPQTYTSVTIGLEDLKSASDLKLKPQIGKTYSVQEYDWRELIFQMQKDFYQYGQLDSFLTKVADANPEQYPTGITGYEQYYLDIRDFWRELYDPEPEDTSQYDEDVHFNIDVLNNPEKLNFWFDFLDDESEIGEYSVKRIGDRLKVVNDNEVQAIYFPPTPEVLYTFGGKKQENAQEVSSSYITINLPENMETLFSSGVTFTKTAHDVIENMVNQYLICAENVEVSAIPVYDLEPNVLIRIDNEDYEVQRISYSLSAGSSMSITATKIVKSII